MQTTAAQTDRRAAFMAAVADLKAAVEAQRRMALAAHRA